MIKNLRLGAVGLLVTIISFGFIGTLFAQEACGTIIKLDGNEEEIEDCDNPFQAHEDSPFALVVAGVVITEGSSYEIPIDTTQDILLQAESRIDVDSFSLLRRSGLSYYEVEVDEVNPETQYQTTFNEAGTYIVVLNWDMELVVLDNEPWWRKILTTLVPIARAEIYPFSEIYTRTFTITEPTVEVPCGSIIYETYSEPIMDCDNPLNAGTQNENLVVTFAGTDIIAGENHEFLNQSSSFTLSGVDPEANAVQTILYRHSGEDYIVESYGTAEFTFTATGTYSLFVGEDNLIVGDSRLQQLREFFIPTVYAAVGDRTVVTFEVTVAPEPEGASSILFLPGIQASRLYTDGVLGTENKLWEPNRNNDAKQLEMTEFGESINNIYTRDVIDSAFDGTNIYKNFLAYLQTQKNMGVISDWKAFAYDWRYDVFDVVENGTQYEGEVVNPVDLLSQLSADTNSKVTIVAHSNGGLLAKALMMKLEEQGKASLVEKIIFLATPQIGTPKAVGTILHGYGQELGYGYIVTQETARDVIKNMPGAYGLLPAEPYFAQTTTPVITFDPTPSTEKWRNDWGSGIESVSELSDFMLDERGGRTNPEDVYNPSVANATFISEATAYQNVLDAWTASENVEIFEIVGTGLDTVNSFTYKTFQKRDCLLGFINCKVVEYAKPVPRFTQYGDQTVLDSSAYAYGSFKKTYYIDLLGIKNSESDLNIAHADIGESPYVQQLIANIITDQVTDIPFVSEAITPYNTARDVIGGHSPISLRVEDSEGNVVEKRTGGVAPQIIAEIPGSRYIEFAGGKYIIIPSDTDYTVTIEGQEEGSYTLQVERIEGTAPSELLSEYTLATTTPDMVATFRKVDGTFSTVVTDLDGDGEIDIETTLDGEVVEPITYKTLYVAIKALELRRYQEKILVGITKVAERYNKKAATKPKFKKKEKRVLNKLKKVIRLYKRWGLITKEERNNLLKIINELRNK